MTSNTNPGLINTNVTISGGNSSVRFEMLPAFEVQTALPQQKLFNENDIVVSSNPGELTIKVQNNCFDDLKLHISGVDGRLIVQKDLNQNTFTFNTSILPKGYYFVSILQGQMIYKKKDFNSLIQ